MDETMSLGGNIELSGFHEIDGSTMIVVKKIVGNYTKKLSERVKNFEKLKLTMKPVHEREKSEVYELHANLFCGGKPYTASMADRNLFFALDKVLKKIEGEIQ